MKNLIFVLIVSVASCYGGICNFAHGSHEGLMEGHSVSAQQQGTYEQNHQMYSEAAVDSDCHSAQLNTPSVSGPVLDIGGDMGGHDGSVCCYVFIPSNVDFDFDVQLNSFLPINFEPPSSADLNISVSFNEPFAQHLDFHSSEVLLAKSAFLL